MWRVLAFLLALSSPVLAQGVQQGGSITPGHAVQWTSNGIIQDAGTAASGSLTSLGVTNNGGPGVCVNSAPITTDYNSICLSADSTTGGAISVNNYGSATGGLSFIINGVAVPIGGTSITVGSTTITSGTTGYLLYNNGGVLGNLNLFAIANTWSAAQVLSGGATVPTRSPGDNTTNAASTAFVQTAVSSGALTVGTTPIGSGTAKGVLYNNGGVLGNLAAGVSGVLVTDGTGQPSIASTLPANLAIPSPTFSGTVAGANTVPYSVLAQSGANTMLGNWSGSPANVTANAMAACADSGGNHLNYVSGTGITCGTTVGAAAVGTLTGTTLAANVLNSSLTSVGTLTGGSTGTGFTVALSNSTITGTLPTSVLPAFTGNVTSSAGSAALTIGTSQVTNAMLAGSIDLTSKVTGALPIANGGTAATSAATALANLGALPLAGGTMGGALILAADPVAALGAATKQYVDGLISGLQVKASVAAATTANITLSGEQTIDGVLTSTSRVLVKNQSSTPTNGIYVSAAGAWARATDLDVWSEAVGAYTLVTAGSTQANTGWTTQVAAGGTIGVTAMPWAQFSSPTSYSAGSGLTLTSTTFSIAAGQVTNAMLAGSIAASKLVGSDIATVGTIATGAWHGTVIGSQYGGTGQDWSASSGIPLITSGAASLLSTTGSGAVVRAGTPSISALTVTGSFSATGLVTNVDLVNSAVTLGATALTLGTTVLDFQLTNNHIIQWKDSGGGNVNALYLDGSNVFQIGGGDQVNVASTTASVSSTTGAQTIAGGLGVAGAVNSGSTISAVGQMNITSAAQQTSLNIAGSATNDIGVSIANSAAGGHTWQLLSDASASGLLAGFAIYDATAVAGRIKIDNSGNVGIGTTTPAYKLDVNGTLGVASTIHIPNNVALQARNAANSGDVNIAYLDGGNVFQIGGGDNVAIASTQASTSSSSGALQVAGGLYTGAQSFLTSPVGIGTGSPDGSVAIKTGANATDLLTYGNNDQAVLNNYAAINFPGSGQFGRTLDIVSEGGNTISIIRFLNQITGSAAPVETMRVSQSGGVGIGTTITNTELSLGSLGNQTNLATYANSDQANFSFYAAQNFPATNRFYRTLDINAGGGNTQSIIRFFNQLSVSAPSTETMRISYDGSIGIGTTTPGTIATGQGIAMGAIGGASTIYVTPYVDANLTTSALVVQTVDQAAATTNGGTGYEYAFVSGIKSTHNDGSLGPNKVASAGMATMSGASSGNGWGGYFLCGLESGSRSGSICTGAEIDAINSTAIDRNYANLGSPSYGLQVTGTSDATNTAAILISGHPGAPQWYTGLAFNNFRSAVGSFTASISGTTMTVTAVGAGIDVRVGSTISGSGIPANTTISAFGSGTGGTGTYTVSASLSVGSETITMSAADYGIDLAFDSLNTFGQAAIRLPNNQTIVWKQSGGSNLNALFLDGSNIFQVGGGLPVAMPGLGAVAQTNVLCFNSGTGLITYQTWASGCAVSSARYKQDIRAVSPERAFSIVTRLLAVRYQYRPEVDLGSDEHLGFTAEQAASVDPELVTYDDQGRPNAVKYQELTPILAGAVQYLKAANDNLEARLSQIEKRIAHP